MYQKRDKNKVYILFILGISGLMNSFFVEGIWQIYKSVHEDSYQKFLLVALIAYIYVQMGIILSLLVVINKSREKALVNENYLKMQKEQYDYLKKKGEDIRSFQHDVNEHILVLKELCEKERYKEFGNYIKEIMLQMHIEDNRTVTGNGIVDAVVNKYLLFARQEGVKLKIRGKLPEDDNIEFYDYCVIFSNLLKNAIEAAKESEKKRVELFIKYTQKELLIRIWNDYKEKRKTENGRYITTKKDMGRHGIGLLNVQKSVKKYDGVVKIVEKEGVFTVMVSM